MSHVNASRVSDAGVLYVVATPIGNLEDVSRRAVDVLAAVALIAAEDTRRTRSLLAAFSIPAPEILALHEHNEAAGSARVLAMLESGRDVAMVSDAGTPLLSDPGFTLVRDCFARGFAVRPVPGPSALSCALSVCPLPTNDFKFLGFLPARSAQRRARLQSAASAGAVAFFEAPHRMQACLEDLIAIWPDRRLFIGREMTKKFESYLCDLPEALLLRLQSQDQFRGEFVCILEPPPGTTAGAAISVSSREVMAVLTRELAPAQAARIGAELLGESRRALYQLVLELRDT